MSRVRTLDVAVRANTQNFETGMRKVSQGLRATIVGMNAVAAAASGQEKSVIGMINAVAIGFATGGPWGAAIASAGVAIGVLIGKTKEADEEWAKAMASMRSETEKLEKSALQAADKLFEFRGGSIRARELERILELAKEARAEAGRAGATAGARVADIGMGVFAPSELLRAWDAIEAQRRAVEASGERGKQAGFAMKDAEDTLALTIEQVEWETKLLGIKDETRRRVETIRRETFLAQKELADMVNAGAALPAGMDLPDAVLRIQQLGEGRIADVLDNVKTKAEEAGFALQFMARSVSDLLAGVLVNGGKAVDILRSIAQSAASIGIQRGVNAAFGIATP